MYQFDNRVKVIELKRGKVTRTPHPTLRGVIQESTVRPPMRVTYLSFATADGLLSEELERRFTKAWKDAGLPICGLGGGEATINVLDILAQYERGLPEFENITAEDLEQVLAASGKVIDRNGGAGNGLPSLEYRYD